MNQPVVVFGGTFDPVHNGHVVVAYQAFDRLGASALWFMVANIPTLREPAVASAAVRLEMLHAAVGADPRFVIVDNEIRRGGTTYTADTMAELHNNQPQTDFVLLLGADVARSMPAWHRSEEVLTREHFVIVNRAGASPMTLDEAQQLGFDPRRTELLELESPAVSASEVRRRAAAGESLTGVVPAAVAAIITRDGLYEGGRAVHNARE